MLTLLTLTLLATIYIDPSAAPLATAFIASDSLRREPVILDVRIGTIASATMAAVRIGDRALLPVARVMSLAGFTPQDAVDDLVTTDSLAALLHAPITVDWEALTATVDDASELPVSRRAARAQRRVAIAAATALARSVGLDRPDATLLSTAALTSEVVIDYDANIMTTAGIARSAIRFSAGSNLLGGGTNLDWISTGSRLVAQPRISWERERPNHSWLRRVRVGDGPLRSGSVIAKGLFISSESFVHARADSIQLTGLVGKGWDVEAYSDGDLLYSGVADSAGAFSVRVPSNRGTNTVTIGAFGPSQEQLIMRRYVLVSDGMLPAHTAAFDVAVGDCNVSRCAYALEIGTRYAPTSGATAGLGMTIMMSRGTLRSTPSGSIELRPRDDVNASLRYMSNGLDIDAHYSPAPAFRVSGGYRVTGDPLGAVLAPRPLIGTPHRGRRSRSMLAAGWYPGARASLDLSADVADERHGVLQHARAAASLRFGRIYIRPFLDGTPSVPGATSAFRTGVFMTSPAPSPLPAGATVRLTVGDAHSVSRAATLSIPFSRATAEISADWNVPGRVPHIAVAVTTRMRAARYQVRATGYGRAASTSHSLSGSVDFRARSSAASPLATFSATPLASRARLAGRVFIDENRNGVWDTGEPLLSGVSIQAGGRIVDTDSVGEYNLGDVVPFVTMLVVVDTLSLPSATLTTAPLRVIPQPNGITWVQIPVSRRSGTLPSGRSLDSGGIAQHTERGDTSPIHRDDLEPGARDANTIAHARQSAQPREHVPAQR